MPEQIINSIVRNAEIVGLAGLVGWSALDAGYIGFKTVKEIGSIIKSTDMYELLRVCFESAEQMRTIGPLSFLYKRLYHSFYQD